MPTLKEFFMLSEGRSTYYTLEPEANGVGSLLQWEKVTYAGPGAEEADAPDDVSYQVVATGDVEKLIKKLRQDPELGPVLPQIEDEIRQTWEQVVSDGGDAVWVGDEGGGPMVDITAKRNKKDRDSSVDDYSYDDDNPNSYF